MTPLHIAEATGRTEVNPGRYKDRAIPDNAFLGEPSSGMSPRECDFWREVQPTFWWLREHHRYAFADWVRVRVELETEDNLDKRIKLMNMSIKLGRLIGADPQSDQRFGKSDKPSGKAGFGRKA